ncbi:BglG family transcriptional antiterminator [Scopulibacillus darangshiensis]|uniref:BglG family transcriptional antiterminator n=1 Tax=Scopulibacillus darangshiensis TaxID=442528 RepID=A0A4R2P8B2_9BACL|nr:PRD domain-containing protein [Scopulibacillus darangshiensis]TCP31210.1 BglG family transcriptional antiterminator [Scopulibacillus darangshiensis]
MKKEREKAIIQFLLSRNDWVKADILAKQFSVSSRSIRKYVNEINETSPSVLIMSSNLGYKLSENDYYEMQRKKQKETPEGQTPLERLYYLLKQSITHSEGMDIFDLSEKIYVSTSTIEGDLKKAKSLLEKFNLSFKRDGDLIILNGLEQDKRKLMSHIFYEETKDQFLHLDSIQEAFGYDLKNFKEELVKVFASYNLYVNEYTIGNILLHIVIATERISQHRTISEENIKTLTKTKEYKAASDIAKLIKTKFGVTFEGAELYYLSVLLISKTTILSYDSLNKENLCEYIEKQYIRLVNEIIQKVKDYYLVDIYDEEFLIKFTLHIRNLINRARHNYLSKNPLTKQIKSSYPLIYDLAVFISNEIQKKEHIQINEDEIAYIAFHIGAFLERQKVLEHKITCTVVCPEYYNMHISLIKRLEKSFGLQMEISRVITTADFDLGHIDSDIIITTIQIPYLIGFEVIYLNPFILEEDILKIQNSINQIKKERSHIKLKNHLASLFDPHLFQQNIYLQDEFEMIRFIGEKMVQLGFIEPGGIYDIIEREKMSSTSFNNNVAVPHSMHMDALKSSISIVLNDKPVNWGNNSVQIIALIALNKDERSIFRDIYDSFIKILSEPENVYLLLKSKNYDGFINNLISLMED